MALSVFSNIAKWAGSLLSPASNTAGDGSRVMPDVRATGRKFSQILSVTPLPANATYSSPWFDTNSTGAQFVHVSHYSDQSTASITIQGTDDIGSPNLYITLGSRGAGTVATVFTMVGAFLQCRYWRVVCVNGVTQQTFFRLTSTEYAGPPSGVWGGTTGGTGATPIDVPVRSTTSGDLAVTVIGSGSLETAAGNPVAWNASSGGINVPGVLNCGVSSAPNSGAASIVVLRVPNIFRGSQFSGAGQNVIWATTKKFRLMKYKIEIGEDATITSGPLPINLGFSQGISTANGGVIQAFFGPAYTHRMVIPAAVLATSFDGYDSGWIDLGNGILSNVSTQPLTMGIMVPQPTAAVNPTWTIASNQWEAATVGFKTNGNLGNFKVVNIANVQSAASVASVACGAIPAGAGNSIFVFIRTTRVVGGASVITVTDTALNTYTVTAQVVNATDGANGTALCMAYATNIKGNASNIITVNFGTNNSTGTIVAAFEYAGMGTGGIDAAQVGATGNSTSPASGNYTPGTTGDLIFSFFGSTANIGAAPTVDSNFRPLTNFFTTSNTGSLGVADNFGNGALATGQINVICAGTEE